MGRLSHRIVVMFVAAALLLPLVPSVPAQEAMPPQDPAGCDGCDLRLVEIRVTQEGADAPILVRSERVLTHELRHFAIASVGFNDPDGSEESLLVDDLEVVRADGTRSTWRFDTAPEILRGASGYNHTAIRYDSTNKALQAVVNSSYGCAPGYQTIEVAPPTGPAVQSMSIAFQKITPNRGGSDYWDLHVGLVPDNMRPAIPRSSYQPCEAGHPQGSIQELVGLQIEGNNAGWRHTMQTIFNGSADAKVVADHRLGARYTIEIEVHPTPLVQGQNLETWGEMWETPTTVNDRQGYIAYAMIHNSGDQPTAAFDVLFSPHPDRSCPAWEYGDDPYCSIVRVRGLGPGEFGIIQSAPMEGSSGQRHMTMLDSSNEISETDETDNRYVHSLSAVSDLVLTTIGHDDWRSLYVGDTLNLSARVENAGYRASSPFTLDVFIDDRLAASRSYEPIEGGWWSGVTLKVPTWTATLGTHVVTATITVHNASQEHTVANNQKVFAFSVEDPGEPGDLVPAVDLVYGFFPHKYGQDVPPGAPFTAWIVIVNVCNTGEGPVRSGSVAVRAEAEGVGGNAMTGAHIGRFETGLLPPLACVGEIFVWQPLLAIGEFDVVAHATSRDDIAPEVELENNEDRKRISAPIATAGAGIIV